MKSLPLFLIIIKPIQMYGLKTEMNYTKKSIIYSVAYLFRHSIIKFICYSFLKGYPVTYVSILQILFDSIS